MRKIIYFCCVVLLSGCADQPARIAETSSGHPEVLIKNVTVSDVHDRLVERLLSGGKRIDSDTPSSVVVSEEMTGQREAWMRLAIANAYSTKVRAEITFSMVKAQSGVKVFARMSAWSQMPLGQIKRIELNGNNDFNEVQQALYDFRDGFMDSERDQNPEKPITSMMLQRL
jgi:hypothetical protein